MKHCDDYIEDETQPEALRRFLHFKRLPASLQFYYEGCEKHIPEHLHQHIWKNPEPVLFADFEGQRVRVTMASRFGDVGITSNLKAKNGYDKRVFVETLSNFGTEP